MSFPVATGSVARVVATEMVAHVKDPLHGVHLFSRGFSSRRGTDGNKASVDAPLRELGRVLQRVTLGREPDHPDPYALDHPAPYAQDHPAPYEPDHPVPYEPDQPGPYMAGTPRFPLRGR